MLTLLRWTCVAILLVLPNASGEFFSSVNEMSKVFKLEEKILRYMDKFIDNNEIKLNILQSHLDEFSREYDEALINGEAYFDSPLNTYLHTKRLSLDWERIENLMKSNAGEVALNKIKRLHDKRILPDEYDLDGAINGLLRLQYIYRLKTKDLAAGLINGVQYTTQLTAQHCSKIASVAGQDRKYRLAHAWLIEALNRFNNETDMDSADKDDQKRLALVALMEYKIELGDINGVNSTYFELLQLQPTSDQHAKAYSVVLQANDRKILKKTDIIEEYEAQPTDFSSLTDFERYRYTCNGLIKQTPNEERVLRCGYLSETHAFLTLAPLKVEELNHDPLLVVYHDVISDNEIETIKNLTNYKMERATTIGDNSSMVSNVRTSQFVFIPKTEHKVLEDIDIRVADMTNLNMFYAEDHQFSNYGIGGHYAQHMDWFNEQAFQTNQVSSPEMGNRIATVLFYLSDVEQGGGTAFPKIKRLLMPKKGAAVFWYNLHSSGPGDHRTMHGACPIIVGSKWVQNRWIREFIQSDRRPCELWDDSQY